MERALAENVSNALMILSTVCSLILYCISYKRCFKTKLTARERLQLLFYSPSVALLISFILWAVFWVHPFDPDGRVLLQTIWRAIGLYLLFAVCEAIWLYLVSRRMFHSNRPCLLFLHFGFFVFSLFLVWIAVFFDQLLMYWPVASLLMFSSMSMVVALLYMKLLLPALIQLSDADSSEWQKEILLIPFAALLYSFLLFVSMMRLNNTVFLYIDTEPEVFSSLENYHTFTYLLSMFFVLVLLILSFFVILRNMIAHRQVKILSVEVMEALSAAIDAKDPYTSGHSQRVARYSRMIAEKLGLSKEDCENVYYYGLLHDVGKIHVPNEIINKPSKLTDEEYSVIKSHPGAGSTILSHIKSRPDLAIGAHWHHERIDGGGYPDKITGNAIPFLARIIAVADAYDAMTSNRSYRQYLPQDVVREEIRKGIGTQFDEKAANCMLAVMDDDKDYKLHE